MCDNSRDEPKRQHSRHKNIYPRQAWRPKKMFFKRMIITITFVSNTDLFTFSDFTSRKKVQEEDLREICKRLACEVEIK